MSIKILKTRTIWPNERGDERGVSFTPGCSRDQMEDLLILIKGVHTEIVENMHSTPTMKRQLQARADALESAYNEIAKSLGIPDFTFVSDVTDPVA